MIPQDEIRWSVNAWSVATGMPRANVRKKIEDIKLEAGEDGKFSTRQMFEATSALKDLESARIRKTEAEARLAELKANQEEGLLYDADQINERYIKKISVIASRVNTLPQVWSARVNPQNPQLAHKGLEEAARHILAPIEDDLNAKS